MTKKNKQIKNKMILEFKGKITNVADLSGKKKDGSAFVKFQYVIEETSTEHPNSIVVTTFGDKIPKIALGSEGIASVNMKVSEFNGKYYNNLNMWKWESQTQTPVMPY